MSDRQVQFRERASGQIGLSAEDAPLRQDTPFAVVPDEGLPREAPVGGWLKRSVDIAGALTALVVAAPIMLVCAAGVKATTKGPVFFGHTRIGHGGKRFKCFKFRSMQVDADARLKRLLETDEAAREEWRRSHKLTNDPRITRIGAFLRSSSLDELPQLFNVLRGDMSLVGPRPIVDAEIVKYGAHFHEVQKARPGITGLWQVSGRSETSYAERVDLDRRYVGQWSLWLDFVIACKTVVEVLRQKGAR